MIHAGPLNEGLARVLIFVIVFVSMALWERLPSLGGHPAARSARWPANLGLAVIDTLVIRVLAPAGAVGIAVVAMRHHIGLFNWVATPWPIAVAGGIFILDVAIYWQHRLFHSVTWLWRLHRVHHADTELDVSTALRFHPAEAVLSMAFKAVLVLLFGMPPISVLAFEVILNAAAMFNHTNVNLPGRGERWLNRVLVTPEMHRLHHSTHWREANQNFGFSVSWWDRIFHTYGAGAGHLVTRGSVGLPDGPPAPAHMKLLGVLLMPWSRRSA
jgi:sterol desaturase/sphingolipid hydroxylase (fatty acid hydroxylase superfamily)